jgi:hypothetical protein
MRGNACIEYLNDPQYRLDGDVAGEVRRCIVFPVRGRVVRSRINFWEVR